jgi:hypothetical protein
MVTWRANAAEGRIEFPFGDEVDSCDCGASGPACRLGRVRPNDRVRIETSLFL